MDMNLNKLWEVVKVREDGCAASQRVGHYLAAEQQQQLDYVWLNHHIL